MQGNPDSGIRKNFTRGIEIPRLSWIPLRGRNELHGIRTSHAMLSSGIP